MAVDPFIVFALPRSRTYWLSRWLATAALAPVGHDTAIEADSVDIFLECLFRNVRGTVETGAVDAAPLVMRAIPNCRVAVVLRSVSEVAASLASAGFPFELRELERRAAALEQLAGQPGVFLCLADDLGDVRTCAKLQEHLLGRAFVYQAWDAWQGSRTVIEPGPRLARLAERHDAIAALKQELRARLAEPQPFVTVGEERWADVAATVVDLGARHHAETTGGREGEYAPDMALLAAAAADGVWRAIIARVDGYVVGYCLWSAVPNHESRELPTLTQGPFYVVPEHAALKLGPKLLLASRRVFAAEGIAVARLHHTTLGRGAKLGALYAALGAVEHQREFIWKIGA